MKKKSCDFLWFQSKGYDKVRAIYKLRKEIHKFGDKLGKRKNMLNHIIHKDPNSFKFSELNITKLYPKKKLIYFSNDLIKSLQNKSKSEEIKNDNNNINEQKLLDKTTTKELDKEPFEEPEIEKNNETLNYSTENKYLRIFTKIKKNKDNKKQISNQRNIQNNKLLGNVNEKTNNDILNTSRNYSNRTNNILTPKNINDKANVTNCRKINKNIKIQKSSSHGSNINILLDNYKNIIPKMHILKLKLNFNSTKLKKNSSESKIHKFKLVKPRNFFEKINKYRSEEKMKKIKSKDPYNMNGELTKNIMESITIEKLGQTLNASFLNKGVETATIPNFNFFYRKRMPSYIRFPFINKVSLPKVDFNRRNFEIGNVSSSTSYGSYFISKDDKTQLNKTKIFL